jgi:hypothetical protein
MLLINEEKSIAIMLLANGNELAPVFMAEHMLPPNFEILRHQSVMNELGMCRFRSVDIDTFEVRVTWVRKGEDTKERSADRQYQITYSLKPVSWETFTVHEASYRRMKRYGHRCGILTRMPVWKWKNGKVQVQDALTNGVMTPAKYLASLAISQLPVTESVLGLEVMTKNVGESPGTVHALPCAMWMWYPCPKLISLQAHLTEIDCRKMQADALDYPTIQGWYRVTFGPPDEEADEGKITVIFDDSGCGQTYDGPARIDNQRKDLVACQFLTRVGERAIRMAMPLLLDIAHRNAEIGEVTEVLSLPCLDAHSGSGGIRGERGQEVSPFFIPSGWRPGDCDYPRTYGHIRTLGRTVFRDGNGSYWQTGGRNGVLRQVRKQKIPLFFRLAEKSREGALPSDMVISIESWALCCMEELECKSANSSETQ